MTDIAAARRPAAEQAFLDAAERLLVSSGYAQITTRRLAEEASANHGLVHYYFGSMENLFVRVLERFTARIVERQRELYGSDLPFAEKWRQAMRYLDEDRAYQKVWFELQALAWNRPDLRERVARVNDEWRGVLADALRPVRAQHQIDLPLDALVALVMTSNLGVMLERLCGVETGHDELIAWTQERFGGAA